MQNSYSFKRNWFLVWGLMLLGGSLLGQSRNITGVISELGSGEPLPMANVVIKGTQTGTVSDFTGRYIIEVNPGDTLEFSFTGFKSLERVVGAQRELNVSLQEDATVLDEIVVIGYGSSTRKEITGATVQVKGKDIEKVNLPRFDQALQGQVAGVNISTNSGSPGGSASIRIRGLSTFGANDPLILVDGIVYDFQGLNALNPNDIESINVLKDGTAGIYGVRAANGVILIETKKGRLDMPPQFEFSGYQGIQQTARRLDLLNASEFAVIKNNAFANGGRPQPFANTNLGEGTDWQDEVFSLAPVYNYNLSVSGGSEKTKYSLGGSIFDQQGIVGLDKSSFSRVNARLNISTELSDRITLNSVLLYTNEQRSTLPENGIASVLYNTINAYPTAPVRQPDGSFSYLEEVNDILNPIAQMENTYNWGIVNKFVGKEELVYRFDERFSFTNRFNYNYAAVEGKVFSPLVWYGPGKPQNTALNADLDPVIVEIAPDVELSRGASVFENRDTYIDLNFESFVNYEESFGLHEVKGTLGASVFTRQGEGLNATAFNVPNNSVEFADISANQAEGGFLNNAGSFEFEERLLSTFLRAEYNYNKRYLFSAIVRRDGSSRFGPNNRYGIFPVFSGAWIFSEEDFFKSKVITFAKLRASWGISGNDQIPNFAYRALLNGQGEYVWNDVIRPGVAIGRASNPDLKWESTRQLNLGLDLSLWRDVSVTMNYFRKNTRDLLFQPAVSAVMGTYGAGGFPPFVNAGDVLNEGFELEIAYNTRFNDDWSMNLAANMTALRNEVLRVPEGVDFIPGASFGVGGVLASRFQAGFPIGYFIGFETDGIFQNQAEIDNADVVQPGARPGDLRFVDQNGDGVISFGDDSDHTIIGSPIPTLTFGFNLNVRYQNWDLGANFYGSYGNDLVRNYERNQPFANQLSYVIDRWTGPGSGDIHPRVTTGQTQNTVFSDYYVEDGSFLRMRNIQIGYTLPKRWFKNNRQGLRVYFAANNLITFTNYQGFDPDIGSAGGPLAAGIDYGFYPQARVYMGGFNFKF